MNALRSEPMALCQLMLHADTAFNCVNQLGELGMVHFKNLNEHTPMFQTTYIREIRRCEAVERKLSYLMKEMKGRNMVILDDKFEHPAATERIMVELETVVEHLEKEIRSVSSNLAEMNKNYVNLSQMKLLIKKTQTFFDQLEGYEIPDLLMTEESTSSRHVDFDVPLLRFDDTSSNMTLSFDQPFLPLLASQRTTDFAHSFRLRILSGVISTDKLMVFQRMIFRVSHGNIYIKCSNIEVPMSGWHISEKVNKTVFIIFLQGDQLFNKISKVCEGFHANLYTCPESTSSRRILAMDVMTRLEELNIVLNQTQDYYFVLLKDASRNIHRWFTSVIKMKAIYLTLNMMNYDSTTKMLIGECFCPVSELDNIRIALIAGTEKSGVSESSAILHQLPATNDLPTYHKTSKISRPLQDIVDAYATPTYMEINPAIFSIITFPFLFSIMFGDIGHGILVAIFGLMIIIFEKRFSQELLNDEIFSMTFTARYLILMMGVFSIYSGFMYNDIFSKQFHISHSEWSTRNCGITWSHGDGETEDTTHLVPDHPEHFTGDAYPFGMDPVWQFAVNKVSWMNSYKMKLSIIMGIIHMLFGIAVNFVNQRTNQNWLNIYCEVIPQLVFLCSTFGYMVVMVVHKWIFYDVSQSSVAPSLLIGFINMFLFSYPESPEYLVVSDGKKALQIMLLLCAALSVPWMLLIKPIIISRRKKRSRMRLGYNNSSILYNRLRNEDDIKLLVMSNSDEDDDAQYNQSASGSDEHDEENSDVFMNQAIHTIEFCLGCISHTASYLRLWALSLAHGQLSEVLWLALMRQPLKYNGSFLIVRGLCVFLGFTAWAFLTVVILLGMEGLSAFLHTLRLHWIEFMSKFYDGKGYPFRPFVLQGLQVDYTMPAELPK